MGRGMWSIGIGCTTSCRWEKFLASIRRIRAAERQIDIGGDGGRPSLPFLTAPAVTTTRDITRGRGPSNPTCLFSLGLCQSQLFVQHPLSPTPSQRDSQASKPAKYTAPPRRYHTTPSRSSCSSKGVCMGSSHRRQHTSQASTSCGRWGGLLLFGHGHGAVG